MTGELDDPLLMSGVGSKNEGYNGAGHNGGISFNRHDDESSIGLGGMGEDEESQSVRNFDPKKGTMNGIEDSELTNNISGMVEKKKDKYKDPANMVIDKKKKDKKNKDKKKKKKKEKSSDSEDKDKEPAAKPTRSSNRLNKNPDETTTTELGSLN